jgi:hypothetical protein
VRLHEASPCTLTWRNELVNRRWLSSAAAQRNLIEAMVSLAGGVGWASAEAGMGLLRPLYANGLSA